MKIKQVFFAVGIFSIIGLTGCSSKEETKQVWYTLEDIKVDVSENRIEGTAVEGFEGDLVVVLPDEESIDFLKNGQTVRVKGSEGFTMSVPPQLVECTDIEVVD